jgi:hypothetical protein
MVSIVSTTYNQQQEHYLGGLYRYNKNNNQFVIIIKIIINLSL